MPEQTMLVAIDAALRGSLIATLLLLAIGMVRGHSTSLIPRYWLLFAIGLSIQTFAAAPEIELHMSGLGQAPLVAVSVGNGVLFWIFTKLLFDDEFKPGLGHLLFWLTVAVASFVNCAFGPALSPWLQRSLELIQRATPLLSAVLVILAAGSHWGDDLVERRRSLRAFITIGGVIYSLVQLGLRLSTVHGTLSPTSALIDTSMLLVIAGGVAARALVVQSPELLGPLAPPAQSHQGHSTAENEITPDVLQTRLEPDQLEPTPQAAVDPDRQLATKIWTRMADERLYARADVTVASLASTLAVPEYRLRRTINSALGFRNFNSFVNSFRLAEAKEALADRNREGLPILSIALETGFQSIGPFNRAFKTSTGLTPSEFREKYSAENANRLAESFNSSIRRDAHPLES